MQLSAARVFVRDLTAARRFYGQTLGLPLHADGSAFGYCVFRAGSVDLVVESVPADAPPDDQALVGRFTGLSFRVDDAEAAYRDLLARGVTFTEPPSLQLWGGVLATLQDPSGNALQLVQPPKAPLPV
jgi:catechol 2,3-dioxygenase-like lactoylglutathione lyase family enzyme